MTDAARGQVEASAARVYDELFVPALFAQWTRPVLEAAGVQAGQRVLDVACGTGVLAAAAREAVGPEGAVAGLDLNPGMLDRARVRVPEADLRVGRAEALPFEDGSFDAVVSQFGLMFFEDPDAAVREMRRVVVPGGGLAIAVWAGIDRSPAYAALAALLGRLLGEAAADALRLPFSWGDADRLADLLARGGFRERRVRWWPGRASFPSFEAWMFAEIRGWTLAGAIDDAAFERLQAAARQELAPHLRRDGAVSFPVEALLASGRA